MKLPQSRTRIEGSRILRSVLTHISLPGCGRPSLLRFSLRLPPSKHLTISTCSSALDPPRWRFPSPCPSPSPVAADIVNLRRQNKTSAFPGQMSPYATSPLTFSHYPCLHPSCSAFSFYPECPKKLMKPCYELNMLSCPHW